MRDPVERWGARVRVKRRRVMCVRRNDGRSVSAEMAAINFITGGWRRCLA